MFTVAEVPGCPAMVNGRVNEYTAGVSEAGGLKVMSAVHGVAKIAPVQPMVAPNHGTMGEIEPKPSMPIGASPLCVKVIETVTPPPGATVTLVTAGTATSDDGLGATKNLTTTLRGEFATPTALV